jgi:hypothetical protein
MLRIILICKHSLVKRNLIYLALIEVTRKDSSINIMNKDKAAGSLHDPQDQVFPTNQQYSGYSIQLYLCGE